MVHEPLPTFKSRLETEEWPTALDENRRSMDATLRENNDPFGSVPVAQT